MTVVEKHLLHHHQQPAYAGARDQHLWPPRSTPSAAEIMDYTFQSLSLVLVDLVLRQVVSSRESSAFNNSRIFERRSGIGGAWYVNRYPGVAGDLLAKCYSFSFFRKKDWTSPCPPGREILQYLIETCHKFGITSTIQLNTEIESVRWVEAESEWELELRHLVEGVGDLTTAERKQKLMRDPEPVVLGTEFVRAKIVMSCVGAIVEPKSIPKIPGIEKFRGPIVHATTWRNNNTVRGKDVVVVGTGSTGSQIVPALIHPEFGARSVVNLMQSNEVFWSRKVVGDEWFESLKDDRVELSELSLLAVRERSVVLGEADDQDVWCERSADMIVFADGHDFGQWLRPLDVTGRTGRSLRHIWRERGGPQAYLGCVMDGFPNFFIISGPHMVTGHSGVALASEMAVDYALRFIPRILRGEIDTCEVKTDAEARYTASVRDRLRQSVLMSGGSRLPGYRDWKTEYSQQGLRKYNLRLGFGMPARTSVSHTVPQMQHFESPVFAPVGHDLTTVLDKANFSQMTSAPMGWDNGPQEDRSTRLGFNPLSSHPTTTYEKPKPPPKQVFKPSLHSVHRKPVPKPYTTVIENNSTTTPTSYRLLSSQIFETSSDDDPLSESRTNSFASIGPTMPLKQVPSSEVILGPSLQRRPRKPVPRARHHVGHGDEQARLTAMPSLAWLGKHIS